MDQYNDLSTVSHVLTRVYLSGIIPLNNNPGIINELNIKCIICCIPLEYSKQAHKKIMEISPDINIIYLPYSDIGTENLWKVNHGNVTVIKKMQNSQEHDKTIRLLNLYENKTMMEIGFHYMNMAIESNKNVLVHCMAGISRSVSIVIYYLMKRYCLNYQMAEKIVKKSRQIAQPNPSFQLQLLGYQQKRDAFTSEDAESIASLFKR